MFKTRNSILAILVVSFIFSFLVGCSNKYISKSGDSLDMWQKDIDYLAEKLPKKHKNLFFKLTEEEFNNEINELKASLNSKNDDEIIMGIQKIIASAGDGHTSMNISSETIFPMELYWFEDGFYVINTSPEYKNIMYSKLKKINNEDIDSVIEKVSKIISHDNDEALKSQIPFRIEFSSVLYGLGIIDSTESAKFTFEDRSGEDIELEMKSANWDYFFENILGKGKEGEPPLYMKNSDKYYWYEYFDDEKIVYFKYNLCREMKEKSFKDFSKELMDFINNNDVEKLVIDIRDNGGGSSPILDNFINDISKSKLNEEGKIYVVIGRKTFSSAVLNTISLKQKTKAYFVGEATGGKPNHYGEVKRFRLPNSKITVNYSTKHFINYEKDVETFVPDKVIELTVDDYIKNYDPVMQYILNN